VHSSRGLPSTNSRHALRANHTAPPKEGIEKRLARCLWFGLCQGIFGMFDTFGDSHWQLWHMPQYLLARYIASASSSTSLCRLVGQIRLAREKPVASKQSVMVTFEDPSAPSVTASAPLAV